MKNYYVYSVVPLDDPAPEDSSIEDPDIEDTNPSKIVISSKLLNCKGSDISFEAHLWNHDDTWDTIVSPDVLISRKELLLLVAERLKTSRNKAGMIKVAKCDWFIGRHVTVTTSSGMRLHYWGSGTYNCIGRPDSKWQTWVEVEGYDGGARRRQTSRLAFVVCGIQLQNVSAMGAPLPQELREVPGENDSITFLLVRYAKAHASAVDRGPACRPLCPGPFHSTHCLWTWATRPDDHERGCFRPRPWDRHRRYFGLTAVAQNKLRETDEKAWYDIIQVTNIRGYANVQADPDPHQANVFLQSLVWS